MSLRPENKKSRVFTLLFFVGRSAMMILVGKAHKQESNLRPLELVKSLFINNQRKALLYLTTNFFLLP